MKATTTVVLVAAISATLSIAEAASSFKTVAGNKLVHIPSAVVFPQNVGQFSRAGVQYYTANGRDVSVRYVIDNSVLLDAYVYPSAGRTLRQETARQQTDIRRLNKNARLVSEARIETRQEGNGIEGTRAVYDLVRTRGLLKLRGEIRCGSQLMVFKNGPWFVAYRVSYPINRAAVASRQIDEFLAQWRWRGR